MNLLIKCEVIAIFVGPFLLAFLRRRGAITEKQLALVVATQLSLLFGSYYLYLRNPKTLVSLTIEDWSVAIVILLFCWVFVYPFSRWINKQWSQK